MVLIIIIFKRVLISSHWLKALFKAWRISALLLAVFYLQACTAVFFQPSKHPQLFPDKLGLEYREFLIKTKHNQLYGWWLPADTKTQKTILFAHGNAGNVSSHLQFVHWLPKHGYNVMLFDYSGYGRSTGKPSAKQIVEDFVSAANWLQQQQIKAADTVIYAHSLGAAAAISAVARLEKSGTHYQGLVVDSAFSSYRKMSRDTLKQKWWTSLLSPLVGLLITADANSQTAIAQIKHTPILVVHAAQDNIVPYSHGKALYAAATGKKQFYRLKANTHNHGWRWQQDRNWLLQQLQQQFARND